MSDTLIPDDVEAPLPQRRGLFGRLYHGETAVDFYGKRWLGLGLSAALACLLAFAVGSLAPQSGSAFADSGLAAGAAVVFSASWSRSDFVSPVSAISSYSAQPDAALTLNTPASRIFSAVTLLRARAMAYASVYLTSSNHSTDTKPLATNAS